MKTRDRILLAGLRLFNEEGAAAVSTNRVATELEISPGNLYYHFKSKLQIVEWLLRRFEDEMRPFASAPESVAALDDLWLALHLAFEKISEYRFVYRDADFLMREYPQLAPRLQRLTAAWLATLRRLYHGLVAQGVLRAAPDEIDLLALHTTFTMTCWFSYARLMPETLGPDNDSGRAAYHILTLLGPYLEDDSRQYLAYLRHKYLK